MAESSPIAQKERSEPTPFESTRGGVHFTPRVDIWETDQELVLTAEMPGVHPEDINLNYEQSELQWRGKIHHRDRKGHLFMNEYEEGDFLRTFAIHDSIDSQRIEAECKNGVLTVHLPKAQAAMPKQITVRAK